MKKEKKPKKLRTKIAEGLSLGILITAIILVIISVVSATTGNPASIFGYSLSYVPTTSMEPTIKQGSFILIKKEKFSSINTGDIIVYEAKSGSVKGSLIVHRVIGKSADGLGYITQGDNNPVPDTDTITKDMFYGKYVRKIFSTGGKIGFNRNIIFGVVIMLFLLILLGQVVNVAMTTQKLKAEKQEKAKKDLALEEMRKEIYAEELAKLKEKNQEEQNQ